MNEMSSLKFTIIKSKKQYNSYCDILENLITQNKDTSQDEIELLTLLIEKWDNEHNTFTNADPVELLKALMADHNLKAKDLVEILDLSKGTISKILNYHKGLSKGTIRKLSDYFKVTQEAFNRPYKLVNEVDRNFHNTSIKNTGKGMIEAR